MAIELLKTSGSRLWADGSNLVNKNESNKKILNRIAAIALTVIGYFALASAAYFAFGAVSLLFAFSPLSAMFMLAMAVATFYASQELLQMGVNQSNSLASITDPSVPGSTLYEKAKDKVKGALEKVDAERPRFNWEVAYLFKNTYMAKFYDMWPANLQAFLRNPDA